VSVGEFRSIETVTLVNDEQEGRGHMAALYILETYRNNHVQFYENSIGTQLLCVKYYNFALRFYFNIKYIYFIISIIGICGILLSFHLFQIFKIIYLYIF